MSGVQGAADRRLTDDHGPPDLEVSVTDRLKVSPSSRILYRPGQSGDPTFSLGNCEKVPTSDWGLAQDSPEEYEYVENSSPEREALMAARARDDDRLRVAMALIDAGEAPHAKRYAKCMKQSVQLECPTMAGGCGSEDNYTPMTCDSRLCPECGKRRQGQVAAKYGPVVQSWDHPTMVGVGLSDRVEPDHESQDRAIGALQGAFGRLRRRVVPPSGPGWSWSDWKSALMRVGETETARRWQKRYVRQDRGIPFDEVMSRGFYAVDVKEQDDGRLNVHLHILGDAPWIPQQALSHMWDELLGAPVVDVRRVDGRGEQDAEEAALEVAGYAAKAPQFDSAETKAEFLKAVKGAKLVQPFGTLHGNTPEVAGRLKCGECGESPRWWNYVGILDGHQDTMGADWTVDGDRPPPEPTVAG